jgi:hypothetical protein
MTTCAETSTALARIFHLSVVTLISQILNGCAQQSAYYIGQQQTLVEV